MKKPHVVSLSAADDGTADRALLGGKGAALTRLVDAGLSVPAGFCVTTVAYRELLDEETRTMIRELSAIDPTDTEAIETAGAGLRARLRNRAFRVSTRDAITDALSDVSGERYAVRSSATAEDHPTTSFAGQHETFLNVPSDAVIDRVRDCMASLFTDRAIVYRATNDVSHAQASIAVVVQRMINANVSGVLFTADPITGNRHTASIEASFGLGAGLVSGDVTGDTVCVDKRTGEIHEYDINEQRRETRSQPDSGTEAVERPATEHTARALTERQAHTLTELGTEIEGLFGRPQDIEWCLADGDVSIVQSRPITSLFPVPEPEPADDRLHAYISVGHGQAFAETMPPLVCDLWKAYTQRSMSLFGLSPTTQWVAEAGGRIYVDITKPLTIGPLRRRLPAIMSSVSGSVGAALDELLARRSGAFRDDQTVRSVLASVPQIVNAVLTGARAGFPLLRMMTDGFVGAFVGAPVPPDEEAAKWNAWGKQIAARMRDPDTPAGRARAAFNVWESITDFPPVGPLYAAFAVDVWLRRWADNEPSVADDVTAVGRGFPEELVTRINLGLGDLADVARDHPEVAAALRADESLSEIESSAGGKAFVDALEEYLAVFGHRATGEMDVSRPRWRDDPSGLLAAVRANLEHSEPGSHREHVHQMERAAHTAVRRLEAHANHGVFGPVRKRVVHQLLRTYRGYIRTREYPKHGVARMFAAWHEIFRDTGEALAADGQLDRATDVWFLRKGELFAALDGDSIDVDIDARRAEFKRHAEMDAPPVLTSEGDAPSARIDRTAVPDDALVGTGVSAGSVDGIARVVHDPTTETVKSGEILIAPSADPGWTPLFLNAAGMVVEVGGRMSHGALVAREYGLPAVVSVPNATHRIETGQRVRVDGADGTVEILD
ncbi:PEP/pyruvate-binding domain-containing protein [Halocatena pleomorpha]|uniref:PEP/pyruvate-binding domain-containing protein n=1 Tax=Halocatena pleomorpha TaxID=1785090 RepID=UPI001F37704B|nr:PEP/pyruvate-binding domain-containing protein [Halocatena pleomorpha]